MDSSEATAPIGGAGRLLQALERRLVHPAPWPRRRVSPAQGLAILPGPRGGEVHVLHRPAPAGAPTVVFFHGNGDQLADLVPLAPVFEAAGQGLLAVEFPGYGRAPGVPGEAALYEAAERALGWLGAERAVLVGYSLGSAVAVEMALRGHGTRMALLAPFTTLAEVARHHVPWLPVQRILRNRYASAEKAPHIALPVLVLHGTRDRTVPVQLGRKLASRFPRAELQLLEGRDHALLESDIMERLVRFAREA